MLERHGQRAADLTELVRDRERRHLGEVEGSGVVAAQPHAARAERAVLADVDRRRAGEVQSSIRVGRIEVAGAAVRDDQAAGTAHLVFEEQRSASCRTAAKGRIAHKSDHALECRRGVREVEDAGAVADSSGAGKEEVLVERPAALPTQLPAEQAFAVGYADVARRQDAVLVQPQDRAADARGTAPAAIALVGLEVTHPLV